MNSRAGADPLRSADSGGPRQAPGTGGAFAIIGVQALVEYGALNSLMRDASMALQRAGGWAAENWWLVGGLVVVMLVLAFRRS
jgi:hypothetical protein